MSDRHSKWVRVEPGTVIPAGQPHAIQYEDHAAWCTWAEYTRPTETIAGWRANATREWAYPDRVVTYWVDSSWKPPLVLPTTPTWGIAMVSGHRLPYTGKWVAEKDGSGTWLKDRQSGNISGITTSVTGVLDFIPLTAEQIARIEAAR